MKNAALVTFAFKNRLLVIAMTFVLVGCGVWSFQQLKIEAYPDISDPSVVVITAVPGQAAEEVEQQVTVPIERALNSVPRVIGRRSRTIFGLSVVELTFEDGTNDYFARQLVLEKLKDAALPEGAEPTLGPLSSGISELYRYTLVGAGNDPMKLREIQDWIVLPRLLQVPGVADVATFGGLVKQFQIEIDPLALESYGLTVGDVAEAVGANNRNGGGALLSNRQQSLAVRGVGLISSVSDIENIVVDASEGVPVYVRNIGRVSLGAAPQTGIFGMSDKQRDRQGGVEGIVLMRRWENPTLVLKGIAEAVKDLNSRLPGGVQIVPVFDRTELVTNTLRTVSRTLLEGFVVVTAVLLFLLGDLRAALLTALCIPLSLMFAFTCMHLLGVPANLLSLGAFDFGIIVDGTVVMIERVVFRVDEARKLGLKRVDDMAVAVQLAAKEVSHPIFVSLMIIAAAYLPLFTLERVERRIFTPMAATICLALIGSMLLTLTLIPVLSAWLFRKGGGHWENPLIGWLCGGYEWIVRQTVRRAGLTVFAIGLFVVLSMGLGAFLGTEFLPQLDEGVIWIRANLPPGIALEKSAEIGRKIRSLITESKEVLLVLSQSGRNDSGTDPFGPNRNELLLALTPYSTWGGKTKAELVHELSERLNKSVLGATFNFTQPIIDTSTEIATGSSADLAVIIGGPDRAVLQKLAAQILAILKQVPGAADTSIEQEADQAQLKLSIDREAVARYGINVSEVQDVIEMAIGGRQVTTLFEGERRYDVTVRYTPNARASAEAIGQILVASKDGGRIPLSQLADIRVSSGASIIARRENKRQITVRTNIRGRDQGGFVADAQARLRQEVTLPEGYTVSWGGQFENLERAQKRLTFIMPITIGFILILLWSALGSASNAALVLVTVPFSLVGGVIALFLRGIPLSVSAAVGFISVFGVAVMCGLLYVEEIGRRRAEGASLEEAVVQGAAVQMRPQLILITVATLGMMPAALATGIGSDVQRPLATVVVGGLMSTLFLTLLALPAIYMLAKRHEGRPDKRKPVPEE